jgi:hypothetical protein
MTTQQAAQILSNNSKIQWVANGTEITMNYQPGVSMLVRKIGRRGQCVRVEILDIDTKNDKSRWVGSVITLNEVPSVKNFSA